MKDQTLHTPTLSMCVPQNLSKLCVHMSWYYLEVTKFSTTLNLAILHLKKLTLTKLSDSINL